MPSLLHINDNDLVLQQDSNLHHSRGYVWFNGANLEYDSSALQRCRLHPQQINNRYWQQCDQSSIARNDAGMRHAADLVWQHLNLFHERGVSEFGLVVPSHYQSSNLQLLLGICKASQIQATALVNKAVLALHQKISQAGEYAHIDVQMHQTVVSKVVATNGLVALGDVEVIQDVGVHLIEEALLKSLQSNFIQNDRFDPLHDAVYEQQLFDQLPAMAKTIIEQGKAQVSINGSGQTHSVNLEASEFNAVLKPFIDRVLKVAADQVFIDFNGAFDHVAPSQVSDSGLIHLSSEQLPDHSLINFTDGQVQLIYQTELPYQANAANAATPRKSIESVQRSESTSKLFILASGKALPLSRAKISLSSGQLNLSLGEQGNALSLLSAGELFVVGAEDRKQPQVNDRLASNLVDGVLTVIEVVQT